MPGPVGGLATRAYGDAARRIGGGGVSDGAETGEPGEPARIPIDIRKKAGPSTEADGPVKVNLLGTPWGCSRGLTLGGNLPGIFPRRQ